MSKGKDKILKRLRRHKRVRSRISGTSIRPRLSLFRSQNHIWVQLVDDASARTLVFAGDLEIKSKKKLGRVELARRVGEIVAKKAHEKKIDAAVFDRGGYKYHGIVKAVAEGARKGGLKL